MVDLAGRPLTPCSQEKAEQNVRDGLATMSEDGVLRLNYRPLAHRRIYRKVQQRDGWVCAWCGGPGSTLDHVIPVCWGGRTTLQNCVIACRACNHSRNNALPSTFVRWTGFHCTHPVIRRILEEEEQALREVEAVVKNTPLSLCVSREEAQVWVAYHAHQFDHIRPAPPDVPATRLKTDQKPFSEYFVP